MNSSSFIVFLLLSFLHWYTCVTKLHLTIMEEVCVCACACVCVWDDYIIIMITPAYQRQDTVSAAKKNPQDFPEEELKLLYFGSGASWVSFPRHLEYTFLSTVPNSSAEVNMTTWFPNSVNFILHRNPTLYCNKIWKCCPQLRSHHWPLTILQLDEVAESLASEQDSLYSCIYYIKR